MTPELQSTLMGILINAAELEETELRLNEGTARIRLGLYPEERGFDREPEWRRLALTGIHAVRCWTGSEELPAELRCGNPVSPSFMQFVGSLFANQWLDWQLLNAQLPREEPTWSWGPEPGGEGLFLELQRQGSQIWRLGLWFSGIEIETPLETRQSVQAFVDGWRFMLPED